MAAKRGVRLLLLQRRISTAAAKEEISSTQTGVPIILAPHVVKKAYIVHPTTRSFDPIKKYQWLTKTSLHEGLPPLLQNLSDSLSDEELTSMKQEMEDSLIQSLGFQKEGRKKKERFDEEIRFGVLQDLLRVCWSLSSRFPHLKLSYLDHEPKITTHWVRNHHFYQMEHRPAYIVRTKEQIPPFLKDVSETASHSLPGPYDNYAMGLFRHPIVHLRNCPGHQHDAWNLYPHNHTMLLTNTTSRHPDQVKAQGIISMFSALTAAAIENGVSMGQHLETPLATKCVITNGIQFTFMCYQLNTLSLQQDHGIKNCAWASETMDIFNLGDKSKVGRQRGLYETVPVQKNRPSLDGKCLETLLSFLCQQPED